MLSPGQISWDMSLERGVILGKPGQVATPGGGTLSPPPAIKECEGKEGAKSILRAMPQPKARGRQSLSTAGSTPPLRADPKGPGSVSEPLGPHHLGRLLPREQLVPRAERSVGTCGSWDKTK